MNARMLGAAFAAWAAAAALACTSSPEESGPVELDQSELGSDESVLGTDRVGDALRADTSKIPTTLAEVEALFGVGRACQRPDSKEIFVVEESQARLPTGQIVSGDVLLPRAVVTGCNTGDLSDPASASKSFGLMVALVSDPELGHARAGDSIVDQPVEVMARDARTGTNNFYVFAKTDTGEASVTRIFRRENGDVMQRRLVRFQPRADATIKADSSRCFSCHVHGAPLMNELRDPWTNWISFKKNVPLSSMSGTTMALVSEAAPNASTSRSSLANDLEPVMRAAIRAHVAGESGHDNGWANDVARRDEGAGIRQLFDSVFCETELNYATRTDAVPLEAYIDPDVSNGELIAPTAFAGTPLPFQMPIRSEFDHAVERWIIERGHLTTELAQAVRLLDDENDIFSDTRCKPYRAVLRDRLGGEDGAASKDAVRAFLLFLTETASFRASQPKRHAFLTSLLAERRPANIEALHADYLAELAVRFEGMKGDASRIATRERARKELARKMFPGTSSPLPLLDTK